MDLGFLENKTLRRVLVLSGLGAVAFVAPLLDLYGKNPEVFVANRTSPTQIVIFAVLIGLAIPAIGLAVLLVAGAVSEVAARRSFTAMVAFLSLAAGMVVSRQVMPDSDVGSIVIGLAAGGLLFGIARYLDTMLALAALAIPVLIMIFLFTSESGELTQPVAEVPVAEGPDVATPHHLVFLQLDEMPAASIMGRDGEVNADLFPAFAELADRGTWYRNAFSDSIATTQSVPAILTGDRGEEGQAPSHTDRPDNLFTFLGPSYEMHVIEWVAELCPPELCPEYAGRSPIRFSSLLKDVGVVYGHLTLPPSARQRLPSIDNAWAGFVNQDVDSGGQSVRMPGLDVPDGSARVDWANWIQRITNGVGGDEPTFSYAHVKAPHVPWETNPSGTHYQRPEQYTEVAGVEGDGRWGLDSSAALLGFQRHLYQVGFVDTLLGRLLDEIERSGTWDDTMIVVIADHGASFEPGEHRRWPFDGNRDDLYRVPLFIKYPGQAGGEKVDLPAFGIDVTPTIVDTLGVDVSRDFDGVSLRDLDVEREHEPRRWCCNGDGVSTDISTLFAQVERNHDWIPNQASWMSVAGVGRHGDMIGSSTDDLSVDQSATFQWSAELAPGEEPKDGFVQTLMTGRVEMMSGGDPDLLVAVGDEIAGTVHLRRDSSSSGAFMGLLDERLAASGAELRLLTRTDDGWVEGSRADISFELSDENGRVLDFVAEGGRRLQVDEVEWFGDVVRVSGWAANVNDKVPADRIYVFAADRLLVSGEPNQENKNVVAWFDSDDLLLSGFELEFSTELIDPDADLLFVVAEFDGKAIGDSAAIER